MIELTSNGLVRLPAQKRRNLKLFVLFMVREQVVRQRLLALGLRQGTRHVLRGRTCGLGTRRLRFLFAPAKKAEAALGCRFGFGLLCALGTYGGRKRNRLLPYNRRLAHGGCHGGHFRLCRLRVPAAFDGGEPIDDEFSLLLNRMAGQCFR